MVNHAPLSPASFVAVLRGATHVAVYDSWTHTDAIRSPAPLRRIDQQPRAKFRSVHVSGACVSWDVADFPPEEFLPEEVFD